MHKSSFLTSEKVYGLFNLPVQLDVTIGDMKKQTPPSKRRGKPVSQNINPNLTFNHKTYLVMDLKSAVCCLIDLSAASLSMEEAPKNPLISGIFSII